MFGIIAAAVGIISTLVAWNLNPRRKLYAELDKIYGELERCYDKRDRALEKNDGDMLTIVTDDILRLCQRKAVLLQRFSKGGIG